MDNFGAAFLQKNKEIQNSFIIYEGVIGSLLLVFFVLTLKTGVLFFVIFLIVIYLYDFILNYMFLKEVIGSNVYYAKIVKSDPKRVTNALTIEMRDNESTYLKEYSRGFHIKKGTLFNRFWVGSVEQFYSSMTRQIETALEQKY